MATSSSRALATDRIRLENLPRDEFVKILGYLDASDIAHLALSCRGINETLQDDEIWHFLCDLTWSNETSVMRWVAHVPPNAPSSLPRPRSTPDIETQCRAGIVTFKEAYMILNHVRYLSGLWRIIGEGKDAGLVFIQWTSDGLLARQLDFVPGSGTPKLSLFYAGRPSLDILKSIEWDSKFDIVAIRVDSPSGTTDTDRQSPLFASEVADVGFGTPRSFSSSRDSPMYGSSPDSSFRQAWSQFMSSNVQRRSKSSRRRQASGFVNLRHLQRVYRNEPDESHNLTGLWIAELEEGMFDVVDISYTKEKDSTHIVVVKVSGPGCLAPGDVVAKLQPDMISHSDPGELQYNLEMLDLEGLSDTGRSVPFSDQDILFYEGTCTYFGTDDPEILHHDVDARVDDAFECKLFAISEQAMALVIANSLIVNLRRLEIPTDIK